MMASSSSVLATNTSAAGASDEQQQQSLAEEWMIRPTTSIVPSFWEIILLQDAETSLTDTMNILLLEKLRNYFSNDDDENDTTDATARTTPISNPRLASSSSPPPLNTTRQLEPEPPLASSSFGRRRLNMYWHLFCWQMENPFRHFTTRNKFKLFLRRFLDQYGPEVVCLLRYILERKCLEYRQATISETMYSTIRCHASTTTATTKQTNGVGGDAHKQRKEVLQLQPMRRIDQTRIALLVAFGPYLRRKFYQGLDQLEEEEYASTSSNIRTTTRLFLFSRLLLLRSAFPALNLWCQWKYLMGKSHYTNLSNRILRQIIRRRTLADDAAHDDGGKRGSSSSSEDNAAAAAAAGGIDQTATSNSSSSAGDSHTKEDRNAVIADNGTSTLSSSAVSSTSQRSVYVLMTAVVAISWLTQVRAWYIQEERRRRMHRLQEEQQSEQQHPSSSSSNAQQQSQPTHLLSVPPPPPRPSSDAHSNNNHPPITTTTRKTGCPLCGREPRAHPTACRCCGHVFCLSCLVAYIRQNEESRCPISGTAITEQHDLIRLYEPTTTNRFIRDNDSGSRNPDTDLSQ